MSGSAAAFAGLTAARAAVMKLAEGLKQAGSGAVIDRAAEKVQGYVDGIVKAKLRRAPGAASVTRVQVLGSLVEIANMPSANGKQWVGTTYLNFKAWWPFRRGMPPFVLKKAAAILAAEYLAMIGDKDAAHRVLAQKLVGEQAASDAAAAKKAEAHTAKKAARAEERAAVRAAKQFKRDTAKIARRMWRESAAGKAARKALAAQRRAAKKAASAAAGGAS